MAEFWWQCPGCQKVLGSDHTSQPFCGSCMRYGRMRFAEQSEIAALRAQLAARDAEVVRLRKAMVYTATLLEPFDGDAEELGGSMVEAVVVLHAALKDK